MSPILIRPVREQFEHDRVIRQLQPRYKRRYEAVINPGSEQNQSVKVGELPMYPDLVLLAPNSRKVEGTVEVETGESVNPLEAMAEWGPFTKLKVPFHLYIPPNSLDTARRLCKEHNIPVAEMWTYHLAVDQVRFTLVQRNATAKAQPSRPAAAKPAAPKPAAKSARPAAARSARPAAARSARPAAARPRKAVKPAKARKPAKAAKAARKPAKKAQPTARPAKIGKRPVKKPAKKRRWPCPSCA